MCSFALLILILLLTSSVSSKEFQSMYMKSVRCEFSEKYVFPNHSCFAKSYSRTRSTINIYTLNRALTSDIFVMYNLLYKYGTIYREVMHTPRFDWCELMAGLQTNLMILQIKAMVEDSFPGKFPQCPVLGIDIFNLTFDTNALMSVFPTGDYKLNLFYYKKADAEPHGSIKLVYSMLTSNKDTFG